MSSQETGNGSRAAWHDILLALAGQITDREQTTARSLLAKGDEDQVADVIYSAIEPRHITLPERDAARLLHLLSASGMAPDEKIIGIRDSPGMPRYQFSPVSPAAAGVGGPFQPDAKEQAEQQAVMATAAQCGVRELFGTWRYPPSALMDIHRIYLAKADKGTDLAGIAGQLQQAVIQVGDPLPQVEVYSQDDQLREYQRKVYQNAVPLWIDGAAENIKNAGLFDGNDPSGRAFFAPDHPRISDPVTRKLVLGYLRSGRPVYSGYPDQDDVMDPARGEVVPGGLQTDGEWIWPAGSAYYLEQYHLTPDNALLEHILARGGRITEPDEAAMRNVHVFLMQQA